MDENKLKIELTGNPFVDTGLGVISALADIDISQLTLGHLKSVYSDGSQIADWNSKFKSFTQLFTVNNSLTHPGLKRSGLNIAIYKKTMGAILAEVNKTNIGPRCWACGTQSNFNFAKVYKEVVEKAGGTPPKEEKKIGRDFFPLAGSLGSDAQFLPSASNAPTICPKCLFAVQYLPIGITLIKGYDSKGNIKSFPSVFQSTSIDFWYELLKDIVKNITSRAYAGDYETLGKKDGNFIVTLLAHFERLQREQWKGGIPKGTNLYVWRFNNFGDSADCKIDTIPNPALEFLWKAVSEGLRNEIEALTGTEGKNLRYSLFQCILDGRDYLNLYPEGKKRGASLKLFALYQTHICSHSIRALQLAHKLAKEIAGSVSEKELKRIQRPEAFKEEKVKNQFRASMVKMAEKGEFMLEDYLDLFPLVEGNGITVEWDGWNLIRFYLYHANEDFSRLYGKQEDTNKANLPLYYYAGQIYNRYLNEKGKDRLQKEVLAQMGRKINDMWLRNQFVQLAESENGFTYGRWSKLCKLNNGRLFVLELLFQMRLLWSQWVYENRMSVDTLKSIDSESTDGLPEHIKTLLEATFTDYVNRRGLDRFHRDILLRLRRKEIGPFWFKEKMIKQVFEEVQPLTEEGWEDFLVNDEGQSVKTERLFQLNLALANLYRMKANI